MVYFCIWNHIAKILGVHDVKGRRKGLLLTQAIVGRAWQNGRKINELKIESKDYAHAEGFRERVEAHAKNVIEFGTHHQRPQKIPVDIEFVTQIDLRSKAKSERINSNVMCWLLMAGSTASVWTVQSQSLNFFPSTILTAADISTES